MIFIHYLSKYILNIFIWKLFILTVNALETLNIYDFQTFEKELEKCDKYRDVEFVMKNNITISHQIEISYKEDVNIHITSSNENVYINQEFKDINPINHNVNQNLMIKLSNVKKIIIDSININGNIGIYETNAFSIISSDIMGDIILSKIKNEFLIKNIHFKPNSEIAKNGYIIKLNESSKGTISNITLDADVSIKQVISIHNCYNIIIKDSKFNGSLDKVEYIPDFHRVFAIYNSKKIELNNLHIQKFGDKNPNGYVIHISNSKYIIIEDCLIYDGFSVNSEMIKISELSEVIMNKIKIYDIYSLMETSVIYNEGDINISGLEFYNSNNYEKTIFNKKICNSNFFIYGSKQSKTVVDKSYIHDIKLNSIFVIKNESKMKIKNTNIENIDIYKLGAPFATSSATKGNYEIDSVNLNNIHQKMKDGGGALFIYQESSANITITNSTLRNSTSQCDTSSIMRIDTTEYDIISLNNVNYTNVETHEYMINILNGGLINFYKVNFINCSSENGIVYIFNTQTFGSYTYFNVDGFNKDKPNNSFIIDSGSRFNTTLTYSKIKNSRLNTIFNFEKSISAIIFNYTTIENNEFSNSAFFSNNITCPTVVVYNSKFISNKGKKGTIFHKKCNEVGLMSIFCNTTFENNEARHYGGVLYYENLNNIDYYYNCTFHNNTAPIGSVCYSKSKNDEPNELKNFFNGNKILINNNIKYGGNFATNPTKIICNKLENEYLSGDYINNIKCKLIDDYNNIYRSSENIDQLSLDEFIYFKIEPSIESSRNIILRGKTTGYCIGDECSTENIRVFGNSGNYNITFNIISFGNLLPLDNPKQTINIIINDCPKNESYFTLTEDQNLSIKSCNLIKCEPTCIHGKCEKNICNCDKGWIGNNCNENPKFKNITWLPWIFYIFGSIEFIFIASLIVLTIFFREMKEIKIGKPFYLISILLGIILQIMIIFLTYLEPSPIYCCLKIWFKYMGNAFIFGSIVVKGYQIANIYSIKKTFKTIKNKTILGYYTIIVTIHVILLLMWTLFDDVQTTETGRTTKGEKFEICSSPKTSLFGTMLSILFIYVCLSNKYETRYIPNNLKEPLGLPIYAYSLYILIDILITFYINSISSDNKSNNDSLSPDIINTIQCISILVFSPIVVYKLNFKKIYNIIYNIYILDPNEVECNNQYVSTNNGSYKIKRQSERVIRDNQRFAISSINFF